MEVKPCRVIGYCVTEKKNAKMNWAEFGNVCRNHGFSLVKVDLRVDLESQGPFFAIIHKVTEVIINSNMGDIEAATALANLESYIRLHPEVIVVDPLDGVRSLMDRSHYYRIVQNSDLAEDKVFTPTFVDLLSTDLKENLQRLKDSGITYPFVCKPSVSHGSDAHQMAIVFNEEGVADCRPPCVAQSFINHNAVLYKIYIVGDNFNVSERPSLKNFQPSDRKTIFFSTADVSKADSTSSLTVLDPEDAAVAPASNPDPQRLRHIVSSLRKELGMMLIGVDIVIEHGSGRYGIIDINIFPGYDGFPNFFQCLMDSILDSATSKNYGIAKTSRRLSEEIDNSSSSKKQGKLRHLGESSETFPGLPPDQNLLQSVNTGKNTNREYEQDDSGFDTGDSSDERKKKWGLTRGRGHGKKLSQQVRGFAAPSQQSSLTITDHPVRTGLGGV
ncbi:hypothetical protein ONE63_001938 [Megalurothrips usitatus]|uniref:Inositol-tetrakisphosphate 1-kinase n=1 Tax=Megalurothrips usitatus TaxID=439358 RepID=A0AAV7XA13_9NEOP|nr:hypothetical protein ONE63_001938 [Megalurothrips usitatus]